MRFFLCSGFIFFKTISFLTNIRHYDFINLTQTDKFIFCFCRTLLTLLIQINMSSQKTVKNVVSISSTFILKLCTMRRVSEDWFISISKASRLFLIYSYPSLKAVTASACADQRVFYKCFTTLRWGPKCETSISQRCVEDEKKL
jgi:hypothetical protein